MSMYIEYDGRLDRLLKCYKALGNVGGYIEMVKHNV